jgi:hypothetical protein
MPNTIEKAQKAVSMLGQLLSFVEGIDVTTLSDDDLFDLMSEVKGITSALTSLSKAGRSHILPKVKANGDILQVKNGAFVMKLGYARISATEMEKQLIPLLSLDQIKTVKENSKGNRPEELELRKNKA